MSGTEKKRTESEANRVGTSRHRAELSSGWVELCSVSPARRCHGGALSRFNKRTHTPSGTLAHSHTPHTLRIVRIHSRTRAYEWRVIK